MHVCMTVPYTRACAPAAIAWPGLLSYMHTCIHTCVYVHLCMHVHLPPQHGRGSSHTSRVAFAGSCATGLGLGLGFRVGVGVSVRVKVGLRLGYNFCGKLRDGGSSGKGAYTWARGHMHGQGGMHMGKGAYAWATGHVHGLGRRCLRCIYIWARGHIHGHACMHTERRACRQSRGGRRQRLSP